MALSIRNLAESARSGDGRYVDLCIQWLQQNDTGRIVPESESLLKVGGSYDRLAKQWNGREKQRRQFGFHAGQTDAARWLVEWMRAKVRGEQLLEHGRPVYSALFHGGRRAGKTDLGAKAGVTYAILRPNSYVWLISENTKKTEELELDVRGWLHSSWYEYVGAPWHQFLLPNGSMIWLRSAHEPEALKTGKCDFAVLNEAQQMSRKAFAIVRAATADSGGLTVLACNPPDMPIGFWIEEFYEQTRAGKRPAKEFFFDSTKNPHVDHQSLTAMKDELDDRTYRREILGEFLPRADVVFHAWRDGQNGNVVATPELGNVTQEYSRRFLGREYDSILGIDLQKNPYPCAVEVQFFSDPDDPGGEPLIWYTDETIIDHGDEEALSAALYLKGYDPKRTALIVDASGAFRSIDMQKNVPSFDQLRQFGWTHLFKPDAKVEKNPPIVERVRCANGLFKNAAGKRRVFSDPSNLALNQALKLWENRYGQPYRRSVYAHLADAATYPLWRFYPRTARRSRPITKADVAAFQVHPKGIRYL